jgi:hypothetical protein
MPKTCSVCSHAEHVAIDAALAEAISYRAIARRYGVSKSTVVRHQQHQAPLAVPRTRHGPGQPPPPCTCPCTQVDWPALARDAQRLSTALHERRDPYVPSVYPLLEALKVALALLAKLTSACAQHRMP